MARFTEIGSRIQLRQSICWFLLEEMQTAAYRFYFLTRAQQIRATRTEPCADDAVALAMARVFLRGQDELTTGIEIWSGPRLVGAVERQPAPHRAA
jgi:hypothetical protein